MRGGTTAMKIVWNEGKLNNFQKVEKAFAIRHRDIIMCPIASLGLMLVWIYDVEHMPFPDMSKKKLWYNHRLFPGSFGKPESKITDSVYNTAIKKGLKKANIESTKISHIGRLAGSTMCDEEGVPEMDIDKAGISFEANNYKVLGIRMQRREATLKEVLPGEQCGPWPVLVHLDRTYTGSVIQSTLH
jgi:hypothetical protein